LVAEWRGARRKEAAALAETVHQANPETALRHCVILSDGLSLPCPHTEATAGTNAHSWPQQLRTMSSKSAGGGVSFSWRGSDSLPISEAREIAQSESIDSADVVVAIGSDALRATPLLLEERLMFGLLPSEVAFRIEDFSRRERFGVRLVEAFPGRAETGFDTWRQGLDLLVGDLLERSPRSVTLLTIPMSPLDWQADLTLQGWLHTRANHAVFDIALKRGCAVADAQTLLMIGREHKHFCTECDRLTAAGHTVLGRQLYKVLFAAV